jgi:Zn-finger in ubiquitin-hydrolases and other protein
MSVSPVIDPAARPSGAGCVECLDTEGWWLHLRRCALCGHVGCCDSSPSQHARVHAGHSGHPVAQSFEPGEDWFWNYERGEPVTGPPLAPPSSRPESQPSPAPTDRVPPNWRSLLHTDGIEGPPGR